MDPYELALRSDPEYDYDILPQQYYPNGGQWKKRSDVDTGTNQKELSFKNKLGFLGRLALAKRRGNKNKSRNEKLALKYYPVFF